MNIGVVGLGYWGSKVIDEYVALRNEGEITKVVACDVEQSKLDNVSHVDEKYTSIDELPKSVDAIHICTSNDTHFEIAKHALSEGLDVLLEKPLTTESDQAYDLVEIASEQGQILQTGHVFRFADVVRRVRDMYRDGTFGDVYYFNLRWTHEIPAIEGTNVVWDLLPHPIDIMHFITGTWPEVSCGITRGFRSEYQPDVATIHYEMGIQTANIQVSWIDPVKRRQLEIIGSERSAVVECVDQTIKLHDDKEVETIDMSGNNTIRAEARNFIKASETHENTFNSAIVGARTVDVIETTQEVLEQWTETRTTPS